MKSEIMQYQNFSYETVSFAESRNKSKTLMKKQHKESSSYLFKWLA